MAKKVSRKTSKTAAKSKTTKRKAQTPVKKPKTPLKTKIKAKAKKTATPKTKSIKKPTKKKAKPSGPQGYTEAQNQKFKDEKVRLAKFSNQALKDMLKKNLQSMSGNKDDLILKVADGIVLGRIPRCPNCFGGRPRFDYKTGTYSCPGYRDDEDYKNCHSSFTKAQLKRDPWE